MDTSLFFLPLLGAAMLALLGVCFQLRIAARASAYLAASAAISVSIVSFLGAALLSMKYLSHVRILGFAMPWCSMMEHTHVAVGTVTGIFSTLVVLLGAFRAAQFMRRVRRAHLVTQELRSLTSGPILLQPDDAMYAYSVPGSVPLTILSSGLVEQLDDGDRRVVLAHEAGHHRYRHDRFLFVGRVATALFAPTWFLARGLEHWNGGPTIMRQPLWVTANRLRSS
jgi:Zn-dependent protease with chaperone function